MCHHPVGATSCSTRRAVGDRRCRWWSWSRFGDQPWVSPCRSKLLVANRFDLRRIERHTGGREEATLAGDATDLVRRVVEDLIGGHRVGELAVGRVVLLLQV